MKFNFLFCKNYQSTFYDYEIERGSVISPVMTEAATTAGEVK